jgi:uncharacterized protein YjdB
MRRLLLVGLLLTGACLSACLNGTLPSPVASLLVSNNAAPTGVFVGDQVQLNTTALDVNGNPIPIPVFYTSSNLTIATVSTDGLVSILAAGTVAITINAGSQNTHINITVDPNISAALQLTPASFTFAPGQQIPIIATILTTLGHPARNRAVTWSTSDATKVTVDQTGLATAVTPTSGVSICAAAGDVPSVKGCATVIVQ